MKKTNATKETLNHRPTQPQKTPQKRDDQPKGKTITKKTYQSNLEGNLNGDREATEPPQRRQNPPKTVVGGTIYANKPITPPKSIRNYEPCRLKNKIITMNIKLKKHLKKQKKTTIEQQNIHPFAGDGNLEIQNRQSSMRWRLKLKRYSER